MSNKEHTKSFLKGLTTITGIPQRKLQKYAEGNSLFNILEHPQTIDPNSKQLEKISLLNEFISSYNLLRVYEQENKLSLSSSTVTGQYFASLLGGIKDKEKFMVTFLDSGNNVIETRTMTEGGINEAVVYPREVLKAALACDCKNLILAHNHPGGSLKASSQDIELTKKLHAIFTPLDIGVLDHVIIAGPKYISMAEQGLMPMGHGLKPNYEPVIMNSSFAEDNSFDKNEQETIHTILGIGEEEWER